jgi:hypothetical protein
MVNRYTGSYHLSYLDDTDYRDLGKKTTKGKHKLHAGWHRDFTTLPVVMRFTCAPHVSHRAARNPGLTSGACKVIDVRTGAPFVQDGVTGVFVDRLPPGAKCVKNDADAATLAAYIHAVQVLQTRDRKHVREQAALAFHPVPLVDGLLEHLERTRGHCEDGVVRPATNRAG